MVDDVARAVAWVWARRTPAARTMNDDDVQWLLATPMWLTLMTALDASWAAKTRARISALRNVCSDALGVVGAWQVDGQDRTGWSALCRCWTGVGKPLIGRHSPAG
jgi:hypothetical protein